MGEGNEHGPGELVLVGAVIPIPIRSKAAPCRGIRPTDIEAPPHHQRQVEVDPTTIGNHAKDVNAYEAGMLVSKQ